MSSRTIKGIQVYKQVNVYLDHRWTGSSSATVQFLHLDKVKDGNMQIKK